MADQAIVLRDFKELGEAFYGEVKVEENTQEYFLPIDRERLEENTGILLDILDKSFSSRNYDIRKGEFVRTKELLSDYIDHKISVNDLRSVISYGYISEALFDVAMKSYLENNGEDLNRIFGLEGYRMSTLKEDRTQGFDVLLNLGSSNLPLKVDLACSRKHVNIAGKLSKCLDKCDKSILLLPTKMGQRDFFMRDAKVRGIRAYYEKILFEGTFDWESYFIDAYYLNKSFHLFLEKVLYDGTSGYSENIEEATNLLVVENHSLVTGILGVINKNISKKYTS